MISHRDSRPGTHVHRDLLGSEVDRLGTSSSQDPAFLPSALRESAPIDLPGPGLGGSVAAAMDFDHHLTLESSFSYRSSEYNRVS